MKLVMAIIQSHDARRLRHALVAAGIRFTEIGSTGGFLREGNLTLLIGIEDDAVDDALALVREHCRTRQQMVSRLQVDTRMYASPVGDAVDVEVGGAQVFVLNIERVETI